MFLDMNLIAPVRESNSDLGAKRRRQEREDSRKVTPAKGGERHKDEGEPREPKGQALSAYV